MNAELTVWEQAEHDADLQREHDRPRRHLATLTALERRERRFWPPLALTLITGAFALAGLIENGYIQ